MIQAVAGLAQYLQISDRTKTIIAPCQKAQNVLIYSYISYNTNELYSEDGLQERARYSKFSARTRKI